MCIHVILSCISESGNEELHSLCWLWPACSPERCSHLQCYQQLSACASLVILPAWTFLFFLILIWGHVIDFRERKKEEEREGEKHWCDRNIDWFPFIHVPNGDWTCNPALCPDQESNPWPFWFMRQCSNSVSHTSIHYLFWGNILYYIYHIGFYIMLPLQIFYKKTHTWTCLLYHLSSLFLIVMVQFLSNSR